MHWIWRIAPLSIFIGLAIGLVCWRWPANPAAKAPSGSGVVASQPADQPLAEKKDSPAPEARIEAATAPAAARRGVVDVEWVGPAVPQLGQPMDYTVQVRNNSNAPVQKVTLNVRLVPGLEIKAARPPAAATEG
ncbi:MAG: hypothetical protein JO112_21775, partial [Planctomycetes bacterium]|nr:hypothetical protein [Planctomycetota bacterium]